MSDIDLALTQDDEASYGTVCCIACFVRCVGSTADWLLDSKDYVVLSILLLCPRSHLHAAAHIGSSTKADQNTSLTAEDTHE